MHTQKVTAACLVLALGLAACGQRNATRTTTTAPLADRAKPAVDARPSATPVPGDIPDTQQFVLYTAPSGYHALFPEGWARSTIPQGVRFSWHYDGEDLVAYRAAPIPSILREFRDVRSLHSRRVSLPAGSAIELTFASTSQPDAVTGRRITLENQSYVLTRGSSTVALNLWAPTGSDNVDQWRRISRSFHW